MQLLRRICLGAAGIAALLAVVGIIRHEAALWQPAAVATAVALAVGLGAVSSLATYQFTAWIVAGFVVAMIYPERLLRLGGIDLLDKRIILTLIQLVMFGMGTQMSLRDFAGVLRMPHGVLVGVVLQFTVMPLVGFTLATTFDFPPEVAAGIVLVGSCSSGLASNVMSYIAGANLPLSITLTAVATLLAPLMTPLWMWLLASQMVPVSFLDMMLEIVKIVIVPIGAAMLADYLNHASHRGRRIVFSFAAGSGALLAAAFVGWSSLASYLPADAMIFVSVVGYLLAAIVGGVVYYHLQRRLPLVARLMPWVAMFGIVYVTSVTTAAGRDRLLVIGWMLLVAVAIHNTTGYLLGYWLSRLCGLDEKSARTVALEVGLQNGGMASTIAAAQGQLATLGLAAAVFNPWMNTTGSLLANYWRRRPVTDDSTPASQPPDADKRQAD